MLNVLLVTFMISVTGAVASAQDFDAGLRAYNAGDYQTALKEWRPLAEKGDARAQHFLGNAYEWREYRSSRTVNVGYWCLHPNGLSMT